eukprot:TRINITY_DN1678_c0_g1_i1.p1 TRINITY_DN1678_c0_g1~~TRINITY_DN1678_c0_g1_i1.p1  ORF type:complete len:224 (-),score=19.29 TRINITY_DN1678_c0_g1_i1:55-726(-)
MTETWSTLEQLKPMLIGISPERLVFFDMCSGKGYLSCLLSFVYPEATIIQIDNNRKMNMSHLEKLPNVEFHILNIFDRKMPAWLSEKSQGKIGVLLGIHLCGRLSEQMISFFNNISSMKIMILSPCCLNKANTALMDISKRQNIDSYTLWTLELFFRITRSSAINLSTDKEVISEKNNFLTARKTEDNSVIEGDTTKQEFPTLLSLLREKYCPYLNSYHPCCQ